MIEKFKSIKIWHIIIIILGAILMMLGAFHSNIWFDEAYTVGLVNHSFIDIFSIGIHDVHPLLYYILLKLFNILTGNSIIAMRIFSTLGMITLSIIGFTHIRKDFGEKVGLIYSFLISFLPITLIYSNEIRMYSWAAVFVILSGVYAFRIVKESSKRNWLLFITFSLLSAYTHYFATIAIAVINLFLFVYAIKNRKKEKEITKWIKAAITQIIIYIPGLIILIFQALRVAKGFWIEIKYPDIIFDIIKFNFIGNITENFVNIIVFVFAILLFIYLIIKTINNYKKDKQETIIPILSVSVYISVIILSLFVSIIIQDIFITRYTIPMLGLFVIYVSFVLSKSNNKLLVAICTIILVLSIYNSTIFINNNYNEDNNKPFKLINTEIQENDIFVYSKIELGSIIADYYPNNKQYYYNMNHWSVQDGYKAFAPQMEVIEDLTIIENYVGRIWIIDMESNDVYDIISNYPSINIIKNQERIITPYKNLNWVISLVDKK